VPSYRISAPKLLPGHSPQSTCSTPVESAVLFVQVGNGDVTAPEPQTGVSFPLVIEPVNAFELDRAKRVDEKPEHAASSDSGELQRVTDQRDPPSPHICEPGKFGQFRRGQPQRRSSLANAQAFS